MSTIIGTYLPSLLSSARNGYGAASSTPNLAQSLNKETSTPSQNSSAATVTLSDAARAYLASTTETNAVALPLASVAANARAWFDQQYSALGISSAMLDGQVAVDLTGQSRATLSAVASNAEGLFSADESEAAGGMLQSRFDDAMMPYVVIARHTGDYASLYQAASDYLDQAGSDERATPTWQSQKQAVVEGLAAAKAAFGEAPAIDDGNDPIHALLGKTSANGSPSTDTSTESVAANARAMLDAQENNARDNGTRLVFDPSLKTGHQVDFSQFDNRSLATMVLDPDSSFSGEEARAAKNELDRRTRMGVLDVLNTMSGNGNAPGVGLGLIQLYATMSDEEKSVLGVTEDVTNRLVQNYRTMMWVQDAFSGRNSFGSSDPSLGLSAYI